MTVLDQQMSRLGLNQESYILKPKVENSNQYLPEEEKVFKIVNNLR